MNEIHSIPREVAAELPSRAGRSSIAQGELGHKIDLREVVATLRMQIRAVAIAAAVIFVVLGALVMLKQKTYTAVALIDIDPTESEMVSLDAQKTLSNLAYNSAIDTEVEILNSSSVAISVIKDLKLWQDPEFAASDSLFGQIKGLFSLDNTADEKAKAATFEELSPDQIDLLVKALAKKADVSRRSLTSIIEIRAKSRFPQKSAEIANAIARNYLAIGINSRLQSAQQAAEFLQAKLDQLAGDIQSGDAEVARVILEKSSSIGTADTQSLLAKYRTQLTDLDTQRTSLLAANNSIGSLVAPGGFTSAAGLNVSPALTDVLAQRRLLADKVNSGNPSVKQQLDELDANIRNIARQQIADNEQKIGGLSQQQAAIRKSVEDLVGSQSVPSELAMTLYRLQKQVSNSQRLYDSYSSRLSDLQQVAGTPVSTGQLVSQAISPAIADPPARSLLLLVSAMVAGVFGVGAGFARQYYIGGVSGVAQLEEVGGHQVIGNIIETERDKAVSFTAANSTYAESFRRLRIGVESALFASQGRKILVTSTKPGEGKSTLSLGLARVFALAGQRTLIIEADLRRPSLARALGLQVRNDIVDAVLSKPKQFDLSRFVWNEKDTGLDILFATDRGQIASDLILESARFAQILKAAEGEYANIIIDSPPVGSAADALLIQPMSDVVLYVTRSGSTNQRDIAAGARLLNRQANARPLYFVLNRTQDMLTGYGTDVKKYGY